MSAHLHEYFGAPEQQALQQRADHVWTLLKDDPRFCCHGRAVGLAEASAETIETQVALAKLQGACSVEGVPKALAGTRHAALAGAGLKTDQFDVWCGDGGALSAAEEVIRSIAWPSDLEIVSVDGSTSGEDMAQLDALTQSCGVLLPMGAFMRGHRRPAVCLFARDSAGRIVGSTAAVAQFHPGSPKAGTVWWGMLATDEARRGQGIAVLLGAHSMLAMRDRFGYEQVFTGIREGNTPSERLCGKLGLSPSDTVVIIAIAPELFASGRVTK
ncbi:N-acetyltransferase family protein [Tropicibacter sp. S64]|uniref:GNAT family N-acetyltransferase n=1 Tax=Tropicibacter sp. S64 TaxID=3415122 RepID=UPI003C7AD254